jgi:hypothetical protein
MACFCRRGGSDATDISVPDSALEADQEAVLVVIGRIE